MRSPILHRRVGRDRFRAGEASGALTLLLRSSHGGHGGRQRRARHGCGAAVWLPGCCVRLACLCEVNRGSVTVVWVLGGASAGGRARVHTDVGIQYTVRKQERQRSSRLAFWLLSPSPRRATPPTAAQQVTSLRPVRVGLPTFVPPPRPPPAFHQPRAARAH